MLQNNIFHYISIFYKGPIKPIIEIEITVTNLFTT